MTKIEAENILKERAGLDAYTIQFLGAYKYGEELMVKLEKACSKEKREACFGGKSLFFGCNLGCNLVKKVVFLLQPSNMNLKIFSIVKQRKSVAIQRKIRYPLQCNR